MEDPLYTFPFLKKIIEVRTKDIIGVALVSKGDKLTVYGKKSKVSYILALLLIMGFKYFIKDALLSLKYKVTKSYKRAFFLNVPPDILTFAKSYGIPTYKIDNPNRKSFVEKIRKIEPDVIINQCQQIIKKELLELPRIGIINRHHALLPKNRGRVSPFWVLYKNERETGVSIHFLDEKIDDGDIIIQKKFSIDRKDTLEDIVRKSYKIAPVAMLEALDKLENNSTDFIENDDTKATYNTTPDIRHALSFRMSRIVACIKGEMA